MKHPVQFVMAGSAGCFVLGVVLFVTGLISDRPPLKTTGCWFGIAAFLISEDAGYITGQNIIADGGLLDSIQANISGRPKSGAS